VVDVSNAGGTAPVFTKQPLGTTVTVNESFKLEVEATGNPAPTYQWYKKTSKEEIEGTIIEGATEKTLTTSESVAGTYYYYCLAINDVKQEASSYATVTVREEGGAAITWGTIALEPKEGKTVNKGGTVKLTAEKPASSTDRSYKWYVTETESADVYDGTLLSEGKYETKITPEATGTYYYYCELHCRQGDVYKDYRSNKVKVVVQEGDGLYITNPVTPLTEVSAGTQVSLSISTNGKSPKYQWYSNTTNSAEGGTAIDGATSQTYAFTPTEAGTYYYYVVVTCDNGTLTSGVATVKVNNMKQYVLTAPKLTLVTGKTGDVVVTATYAGEQATGLTYTYESSNTAVATVDAATGKVTAVKAGKANIKFTLAAKAGEYYEATGTTTVTVVDQATDNIPYVKFTCKDAENNEYTQVEGKLYTGDRLTVSLEPEETITGDYVIYYTTDGSNPTLSGAQKYNSKTPIKLTQTTIIKAAIKIGNKWGDIRERTYRFNFTLLKTLKNGQRIEPGVGYPITGSDDENAATKKTYIITTYGSLGDTKGLASGATSLWEDGAYDNDMNNSYISGFNYHAIGNKDAGGEPLADGSFPRYNGGNTANNTFSIPINGAYIKFEPKEDGQVNMIVRQNGIIANQNKPEYTKMRKRYAYVCDETGKAITKEEGFKALISTNSIIEYRIFKFGNENDVNVKIGADFEKNYRDYKNILYKSQPDVTFSEDAADQFWKDCRAKYTKAGQSFVRNVLTYDENTHGYYLIDKAYVRYSFPVKAGKTYFLMGEWTKLAPCGYSFKRARKDENWEKAMNGRDVVFDDKSESLPEGHAENAPTDATGQGKVTAVNITLKREFNANVWTSLVLPFSVSPTAVEDAFGKGTEIVHFNKVEDNKLYVTKHFHQMIVAGTPVFIKPANEIKYEDGIKLVGTYETDETLTSPKVQVNPMSDGEWTMTGSYLPATVDQGSYIMGYNPATKDNSMRYINNTTTNVGGTRAWLKPAVAGAKLIGFCINGVEDSETTFIDNVVNGTETTDKVNVRAGIYNLNGQKVRGSEEGTAGLPSGIYIVNGRKVVVK